MRSDLESSSSISLLKAKLARLNVFLVESYSRHAKDIEQEEILVNHLEDTASMLEKFNRQFVENPETSRKSEANEAPAKQLFLQNPGASLEFYGENNQSSKKIICISRRTSQENIEIEEKSDASKFQTPIIKDSKGPLQINIRQKLLQKLGFPKKKPPNVGNNQGNRKNSGKEQKSFQRPKVKIDEKLHSSK